MTIADHLYKTDDETPHAFATCHQAKLSVDKSQSNDKVATILAAWSVLLRDYYAPNTPTFSYLRPKHEGPCEKNKASSGDLQSQCLSISTNGDLSTRQLKDAASQAIAADDWGDFTTTKQKTAVLEFPNDQTKPPLVDFEQLKVWKLTGYSKSPLA